MRILYGYSNCTEKKYQKLMSENNVAVLMPDQKYHGLLIKGLDANGVDVQCFSGLPINREVTSRILLHEKNETEGNVSFHYYTTINLPIIRQLMIFFAALNRCLFSPKDDETYAICDCLNVANAYGMLVACKIRRIPVITIVTDLPVMMSNSRIRIAINNSFFNAVDGFILLTEQMNEKVNQKRKPYIVLEGHVDSEAPCLDCIDKWESISGKRVIIYAGNICKLYGIQNLIKGFLKAEIPNSELWIYGDGDYRDELIEIAKTNKCIVYKGVCNNKDVVHDELKAALLINPRPVAPEYTKYSFPSKNMEYMVSGTPLLTTKLPGMPNEYYPYVFLLDDDTAEGVSMSLKAIFEMPESLRNEQGIRARNFVLSNKSNIFQANKILKMLNMYWGKHE